MATKEKESESKRIMAEYQAALQRERDYYEQLSPEEQEKYRREQELFQEKMDSMNYY